MAQKEVPEKILSRDEAECALGNLSAVVAQKKLLEDTLEKAVSKLRRKIEPKIQSEAKRLDELNLLLKDWADSNPKEFVEKRSIELLHGVIGYRKGPRAVELREKFSWDDVIARLKRFKKGLFLRNKPTADKKAILEAEERGAIVNSDLKKMGVQIVQLDNFFAEPKGK